MTSLLPSGNPEFTVYPGDSEELRTLKYLAKNYGEFGELDNTNMWHVWTAIENADRHNEAQRAELQTIAAKQASYERRVARVMARMETGAA